MKQMKRNFIKVVLRSLSLAGIFLLAVAANPFTNPNPKDSIAMKINELLGKMTLEEKLGQLNQFSNPYVSTGTSESKATNQNYDNMIRKG